MRQGARIAVDVGTVRVGVAASDPAATMAFPVTVLRRDRPSPAAPSAAGEVTRPGTG